MRLVPTAAIVAIAIAASSCRVSRYGVQPGVLVPIQAPDARDPDPTRMPEGLIWSRPEYRERRAELVGAEHRPPEVEPLERLAAVLAAVLAGGLAPMVELVIDW